MISLKSNNHIIASLWFISHIIIGVINDAVSKKLGSNIPSYEIVFLRFLFSSITLLPFLLTKSSFKTPYHLIHLGRGFLLFSAITIWCICLKYVPMVMVTLAGFTIPLFFLILAYLFLNENIGKRWIISLLGFTGIVIALDIHNINFNPQTLLLILGAIAFAGLDVINKKYVTKESTLNMLFYSSLYTMLFGLILILYKGWTMPSLNTVMYSLFLGIGANLLLFALLKSFSLVEASSLLPLRYTELLISALFGYLFFNETPNNSIYYGAAVIIPCNMLLMYLENKNLVNKLE
ncbi:MAG: DMT family transporter [Alphaproteobacteria bacterium]